MRVTKPEKCEKSLSYQNNPSYLNIQRTNPHSFFTINNSPLFIITNSGLRHIELNLHFILYPPVTQPSSIGNSWNGEFGACHTRTANLPRLTAAHLAVYVFESVCEGNFLYSPCERKRNKRKRAYTEQSGFNIYHRNALIL